MKKEICKICGKIFEKKHPRSKTCSKECSLKNQRINHRRNSKLYVLRHPRKRKETCHKYSIKNREMLRIKAMEYRKKNPDKGRIRTKRWRENNRHKRNAQAIAQRKIPIPTYVTLTQQFPYPNPGRLHFIQT